MDKAKKELEKQLDVLSKLSDKAKNLDEMIDIAHEIKEICEVLVAINQLIRIQSGVRASKDQIS